MDFVSLLPLILASLTVISGNDPERITVVIEEPFFAGFHYWIIEETKIRWVFMISLVQFV